jgi:long-chain acyl-CoA synthetase
VTEALYLERPWTRFYPPGTPSQVEPGQGSVGEWVAEAFRSWERSVAILYYGRAYRYGELLEAA